MNKWFRLCLDKIDTWNLSYIEPRIDKDKPYIKILDVYREDDSFDYIVYYRGRNGIYWTTYIKQEWLEEMAVEDYFIGEGI